MSGRHSNEYFDLMTVLCRIHANLQIPAERCELSNAFCSCCYCFVQKYRLIPEASSEGTVTCARVACFAELSESLAHVENKIFGTDHSVLKSCLLILSASFSPSADLQMSDVQMPEAIVDGTTVHWAAWI